MFRILLLTFAVAATGTLGVVLDAQSRVDRKFDNAAVEPTTLFATGRMEGATETTELRVPVSGRVEAVLITEGQVVAKGDVLLQLDDETHRCESARAAAELKLAEAQLQRLVAGAHPEERRQALAKHRARLADLERAQLDWKRLQGLRPSGAVTEQNLDNQRTLVDAMQADAEAAKAQMELLTAPARTDEIEIAKARIAAAKASLELAKVQTDRMKLRAPRAGQILKINVEPGEVVGPTSAEPAILFADTSRLRLRAFVEELDAPKVQLGMPARVEADGLPGKAFAGRVSRLSPYMSRKELWSDRPAERYDTKTREVWIELDQTDGLLVGLRVDVRIDAATPPAAAPLGG